VDNNPYLKNAKNARKIVEEFFDTKLQAFDPDWRIFHPKGGVVDIPDFVMAKIAAHLGLEWVPLN
jgi:hypothetical protein